MFEIISQPPNQSKFNKWFKVVVEIDIPEAKAAGILFDVEVHAADFNDAQFKTLRYLEKKLMIKSINVIGDRKENV